MLHEWKGLNMVKIVNCTECLKNKLYKIYKKTMAFTLAETLIVMGVIGVVAALTLPNLNQSTNNKEKVAKVKKIYQNLSDAFGRAQAIYGPYDEWCKNVNDSDCFKKKGERITEFMKLSKNFGICASNDCNPTDVKELRGNDTWEAPCGNDAYCVVLADGTLVGIKGNIEVDIDGDQKGYNTSGKDKFLFILCYKEGLIPEGESSSGPTIEAGTTNAAWVIKAGNMDYLKCANSLNWNTKRTCK